MYKCDTLHIKLTKATEAEATKTQDREVRREWAETLRQSIKENLIKA